MARVPAIRRGLRPNRVASGRTAGRSANRPATTPASASSAQWAGTPVLRRKAKKKTPPPACASVFTAEWALTRLTAAFAKKAMRGPAQEGGEDGGARRRPAKRDGEPLGNVLDHGPVLLQRRKLGADA